MASKHDTTANRIARKEGTDYNRGKGPDVNSGRRAICASADKLRQMGA